MNLSQASHQRLELLAQDSGKRVLLPCPLSQREFDFSSNDYLCLAQRGDIVQAGHECAKKYGAGATGSRLLSGNLECFEALEAQVAQFKNAEAALVFSSGYQANASGLAALLEKSLWGGMVGGTEPLVFTDRLNHASLHHACQLAGVKQIRFRHNDMAHLAELLDKHAESSQPKIIVSETVFGMEGDLLPIENLAELALQHQAVVYLDEAHATGVWGPEGRGLGAIQHPAIDALKAMGHWVIMGTFSKAVGVSGAYIACSEIFKQYLVNRCTGFVYSTAPSPFVIGAVSKALEIIPGLNKERTALHTAAETLRKRVHELGFDTGLSNTHIVPLVVGSNTACLELKAHLQQVGIRTSAVRPPTVPPNAARVRLALNTGHTLAVYEQLLHALSNWKVSA
ncbi:aminotransferase class I/II-fold pyridoxal phosphate-dependent enzyme [Limnobacter alexandrii]|jgi:8-amino-7-oxononanoate synthase|uniref:aminotransferase class I/II-fold pyridoxal phosphate-dependent enzyme n=1 Tax=Limnobacter alexandrii TaxID=2570352 RepID=UPI001109F5E3|nr:8-amino-7-oxononanoate synthase [Limnobacter alexandrii]